MTGRQATRVLVAPNAPPGWRQRRWRVGQPDCLVAVSGRFDEGWERQAQQAAAAAGVALLSVRAAGGEACIGPLWRGSGPAPAGGQATAGAVPADRLAGCAGCAQARNAAASSGAATAPGLPSLAGSYLEALSGAPLAPGEMATVRADGSIRRHRVRRSYRCPLCGAGEPRTTGCPAKVPGPVRLAPAPSPARVPVRGIPPFGLDPDRMRGELADPRYGPVTRVRRKGRAPFAMTEATMLGGQYPGYGRGRTFRAADTVAILEAFERAANVPQDTEVIERVSAAELGPLAMDPGRLGRYTGRQLAAPGCLVRPYHPEIELDWVWGHRLADGAAVLVPAEVGFYRYAYPPGPAGPSSGPPRRRCFDESSSGSALGASYPEAALHSLIELAERDAFLLAWHRAAALPEIDPGTVGDPECGMLADIIGGYGYRLHLLVATADLQIPVVWALAVRQEPGFPAAFSSAGAHPDPVDAIRSALWELGQLVAAGQDMDETSARSLAADPWQIASIDDHIRYNALPEQLPRVLRAAGGPAVALADAFPGWPGIFVRQAGGDVTGALRYVAGLFAQAGLTEIILVDQSAAEHRQAGLSAVKAVVPGIVPMCFGQPHQRQAGLPRLTHAMRAAHGPPLDEARIPLDPHPFP
ncbi:MAG TPA: YcaO-like family protein [Streptosporangiaceae bacterium]|jgi:ribosomal protein S12 methylthiotransferase accessory factor